MVCAHELGINDKIEKVERVASADGSYSEFAKINPVGQIRRWCSTTARSIPNSTVICDYLATNFGGPSPLPSGRRRAARCDAALRFRRRRHRQGHQMGVGKSAAEGIEVAKVIADASRQAVAADARSSGRRESMIGRVSASISATSQSAAGSAIWISVMRGSTGAARIRVLRDYYAHHAKRPSMMATPQPCRQSSTNRPHCNTISEIPETK